MRNLKEHWNKIYKKNTVEKLGWYEEDVSPTLRLIEEAGIGPNARILNVGAGATTLIDTLLERGYDKLMATDISEAALKKLTERIIGKFNGVECIVDDVTNPAILSTLEPVDLWIDRAVLHFFTEEEDRSAYNKLMNQILRKYGYVLLAQFNLDSAEMCSGLPVFRYNIDLLQNTVGGNFKLISHFNYTYTMPSGDKRPYIYALFQKVD